MVVWAVINFVLLCAILATAIVLHRRLMDLARDVIVEVQLAKAHADQAATISQRTDNRLADGTAKADNPTVIVVGEKIQQKIDELAITLPAKVAEEVRAQVQNESGQITPVVNIDASTVNVTSKP